MPDSRTTVPLVTGRAAAFTQSFLNPHPSQPARPLVVVATQAQLDEARVLGQLRTQSHPNRKPHQDRGVLGNSHADFYGALAEILVVSSLWAASIEPGGVQLFTERTVSGPDFTLNGVGFDVKSVPPGKSFLTINERQRHKHAETVHLILPVIFECPSVAQIMAPIPLAEVGAWQLRNDRHSPYRSTPVSALRPLHSLDELLPVVVAQETNQ